MLRHSLFYKNLHYQSIQTYRWPSKSLITWPERPKNVQNVYSQVRKKNTSPNGYRPNEKISKICLQIFERNKIIGDHIQWRSQDFGSGRSIFIPGRPFAEGLVTNERWWQIATNFSNRFHEIVLKISKIKENFDIFFIYHVLIFCGFGPKNKVVEKNLGIFEIFHRKYQIIMEILKFLWLNFTYPAMNFRAFRLKIYTLRNF